MTGALVPFSYLVSNIRFFYFYFIYIFTDVCILFQNWDLTYLSEPGMSEIGFWPNNIPLKRTEWDFQTILVPFNLIPVQNIYCSQQND